MSFNSNYIVLHCVISHSTMIFSKLVFSFSSLSNKAHLLTQPLTPFLGRGSMGPRPETWQGDTRFTPVLPSAVSKILRHYCKNEIVFKTTNIPTFQTTFINHSIKCYLQPPSQRNKNKTKIRKPLFSPCYGFKNCILLYLSASILQQWKNDDSLHFHFYCTVLWMT